VRPKNPKSHTLRYPGVHHFKFKFNMKFVGRCFTQRLAAPYKCLKASTIKKYTVEPVLATVCKTVRPVLSDRCLSVCLSCPVCDVGVLYCGQTVGWINMTLCMQVGLGPGHTVLDGDPDTPPPKGHSFPIFGPHIFVAKWLNGSRCHLVGR